MKALAAETHFSTSIFELFKTFLEQETTEFANLDLYYISL